MQILMDLHDKWVPPASVNRKMLADQILLGQSIRDLEAEMQLWVRWHLPSIAEELLTIAEVFAASKVALSKEQVYKREKVNYHWEDERCQGVLENIGKGVMCYRCGSSSHVAQECMQGTHDR